MAAYTHPVGFLFKPTDRQILEHYLPARIFGKSVFGDALFPEVDIYALHPAQLDWGHVEYMDDYERYYFVRREANSSNGGKAKRAKRSLRCNIGGGWRMSTSQRTVANLGTVSSLNFRDENSKKTDYLMTEYTLYGDQFQEWVISRIKDKTKVSTEITYTLPEYYTENIQIPVYQELPVGFLFKPTDHQILQYYLPAMMNGVPLPSDALIAREDIYALHPSDLNWNRMEYMEDYERYYLVKREANSIGGKGKRAKRILHSNSGGWKMSHTHRDLGNFGTVKSLNFFEQQASEKKKTQYLMTEYTLPGDKFQEWVICRIKYKTKMFGQIPDVLPQYDNIQLGQAYLEAANYNEDLPPLEDPMQFSHDLCAHQEVKDPPQVKDNDDELWDALFEGVEVEEIEETTETCSEEDLSLMKLIDFNDLSGIETF